MNNQVITKRQALWIMFMCIFSEPLVVYGNSWANQDTWVSMLISIVISLLISIIFIYILTTNPSKDIYDIFEEKTGKIIGRVFSLLFIAYAIFIGSFTLRKISSFIITLSFPESPIWYISTFFMVLIGFIIFQGIENLGRGASLIAPFTILTAILAPILLFKQLNIQNLKPMFTEPWSNIIFGSFKNFFICFGDLALMLGVVISERPKGNIFKAFFLSNIIGGLMYLLVEITNILVLGAAVHNKLLYPTYSTYTLIDVAKFITRIQVVLSAILTITLIFKTALALFVTCNGLAKVFKRPNLRSFIVPLSLVFIVLSIIMFKNTEAIYQFKDHLSWIKGPFQIVIPLIIAIIIFISNLLKRLNSNSFKITT